MSYVIQQSKSLYLKRSWHHTLLEKLLLRIPAPFCNKMNKKKKGTLSLVVNKLDLLISSAVFPDKS